MLITIVKSRAMYCRYAKYKELDNSMLVCCMRDIFGHCKCVGQFDHINNQIKCLRWACKECHQGDEDFHKLIKYTQSAFVELHKDLKKLTNKFNDIENILSNSYASCLLKVIIARKQSLHDSNRGSCL